MNEQSFLGITGVPEARYDLPKARHSSGHCSSPIRIAERTTSTVDLKAADSIGDGFRLEFRNSPEPDSPADATFQMRSFNAFSMDSRELQLKTGRTDGVDYVQKQIFLEQVRELVIHVRFPDALRLEGGPYPEVRRLGQQPIEAAEAVELTKFLDYSPLLRTVTLVVRRPAVERNYRICWRLAPPQEPASEPAEEQLERNHALASRLLVLRSCAERAIRSAVEEEALGRLRELLGQCAGLISSSIGQTIPAGQLEVSLMATDDSDPSRASVLRMVAGSNLVEEYWNLVLPAGDGNAGRAFKKHGVRVFDARKADKDPLNHIYKPIPGGPHHQWLMSIPLFSSPGLIFGVLNVGTFQKSAARSLCKLEEREVFPGEVQAIMSKDLDLILSLVGDSI